MRFLQGENEQFVRELLRIEVRDLTAFLLGNPYFATLHANPSHAAGLSLDRRIEGVLRVQCSTVTVILYTGVLGDQHWTPTYSHGLF